MSPAAIATLSAARDWWDIVGDISSVAVLVGVVAELVEKFDVIARITRLTKWRAQIGSAGLLLLIAGLAVESIAGSVSHRAEETITRNLNAEAEAALTFLCTTDERLIEAPACAGVVGK